MYIRRIRPELKYRSQISWEYAKCSSNWARINRNPRRYATIREIFSHNSYKKRPIHASGASVPKWMYLVLILQLECWKQLLIWLEENNCVKVERPWPRLFNLEKYGSSPLAKSPARSNWLILIVLKNLPDLFPLLGLAHMPLTGYILLGKILLLSRLWFYCLS